MRQDKEGTWILSFLELKICMQMLGCNNWNYFPVLEEQSSLQERIVRSFLELEEMGFVEQDDDMFVRTNQLYSYFQKVVDADWIVQVLGKKRVPALYAVKGECITSIEQISVQNQRARVYETNINTFFSDVFEVENPDEDIIYDFLDLDLREKIEKAIYIIRFAHDDRDWKSFVWRAREGLMMNVQDGTVRFFREREVRRLLEV